MKVLLLLLAFFVTPVYAQANKVDCKITPDDPSCPARIGGLVLVMEKIIGLLAPAAAIAFFVMLLWGGYQFIKSSGDQKRVSQARSTLTYAFIGIILVAAAWLILQLIKSFTGAEVTTVTFPGGNPTP